MNTPEKQVYDALLNEARQALAGLQPTPWKVEEGGDEGNKTWGVRSADHYWVADACACIPDDEDGKRHMEFVAAAPEMIARLIRALESVNVTAGQRHKDSRTDAALLRELAEHIEDRSASDVLVRLAAQVEAR